MYMYNMYTRCARLGCPEQGFEHGTNLVIHLSMEQIPQGWQSACSAGLHCVQSFRTRASAGWG